MGRYDTKRVVITGGSSGIGLATARLLVDEGARVLITGRDQAALAAVADQVGSGIITVVSDAADLADIAALADRVAREFRTFDALFVNAGVNVFAPYLSTSEQAYDEVQAVNAKGPYFTVQQLAGLLTPGSGVVLTTSVANTRAIPMISAYAASKAALRSMTRSLARELLDLHIRVNAVSPGAIDTGALDRLMSQEAAERTRAQMAADNPMLRIGQPAEVAAAAVFLAFEATYTTGAELPVDGGGSQL